MAFSPDTAVAVEADRDAVVLTPNGSSNLTSHLGRLPCGSPVGFGLPCFGELRRALDAFEEKRLMQRWHSRVSSSWDLPDMSAFASPLAGTPNGYRPSHGSKI